MENRTQRRPRLGLHAVAAAALVCTLLTQPLDAHALALGRVVIQSALGEPLRAEIDVPEISAAEAASLRVGLAPGEAFRAAGVDLNAALTDLEVSLQRRADGRAYLRLRSQRPVTEPFVDLILEANWATGRLLRDYTLLLDPPNLRASAPAPAPLPPAATAPVAPRAAAPAVPAPRPSVSTAPAPAATPRASAPAPAASDEKKTVAVRPGDTAGRIAAAHKPANVSLDQMLVALLRGNPRAFVDGNVNRLRSGAILNLPSSQETAAIDTGDARQTIAAQSRDFDEYRRRLAGAVSAADVGSAGRQASGQVQTEVQDRAAPAPATDKLTLAKPAPGAAGAEEAIARDRQARDTAQRAAELQRNIQELSKLGATPAAPAVPAAPAPAASSPAPASAPAETPVASAQPAPAPETSATPSTATPSTATPAIATDSAATTPAPAPVAAEVKAPSPPPAPATDPAPESASLLDGLRDNPVVLPAAGGVLALLAGFGLYRLRQRKAASASVDSSFLESRLQPDSFFGSSGGQRIDTAEALATGSSMVYSPSQLDAAGDVDPVAEADVYLAYGRDLQAEEILKEAMRTSPTRVAIHTKLLEIYAKRRDARAFEVVASEAFGLTQGQGPEWERACELGRDLDPSNPLYQPGGQPIARAMTDEGAPAGAPHTMPFGPSTMDLSATPRAASTLDLDLDFSLDDEPTPAPSAQDKATRESRLDDLSGTEALMADASAEADASDPLAVPSSLNFDLELPSPTAAPRAAAATSAAPQAMIDVPALDMDVADLDLDIASSTASVTASPTPASASPADMMSFHLGDLNLDLPDGTSQETQAPVDAVAEEDPLETKLSLAEEFRAIGDIEGARSLAEEVLTEASGALKSKASTFLADLAA